MAVFCDDPRLSATFEVGAENDPVVVTEVFDTNDYRLSRHVVAGGTVVDLGANIGTFSVLSVLLGAAAVHAFEPHPANRACLEQNLAANNVAARVVVHPQAVTDGPGEAHLAGSGPGVHLAGRGPTVETVGLNQILDELPEVAFLKLDVEGAEYQIIDSVDPVLLRRVAMIAGEFHHPGRISRWGTMMTKLADYGRLETFGHPRVGGLFWVRRY